MDASAKRVLNLNGSYRLRKKWLILLWSCPGLLGPNCAAMNGPVPTAKPFESIRTRSNWLGELLLGANVPRPRFLAERIESNACQGEKFKSVDRPILETDEDGPYNRL